jgi:hypothetical protein
VAAPVQESAQPVEQARSAAGLAARFTASWFTASWLTAGRFAASWFAAGRFAAAAAAAGPHPVKELKCLGLAAGQGEGQGNCGQQKTALHGEGSFTQFRLQRFRGAGTRLAHAESFDFMLSCSRIDASGV